ncbi:MAG: SHOCT domain-containing protein [Chloroflexota bacterium]
MMRRGAMRRGPGLVGTMARTAVIAGTATAVSGAVVDRRNRKNDAQQQDVNESQQVADMQAQLDVMQAQQAQQSMAAAAPSAVPPPAAPAGVDIAGQLQQLASLKAQGILSDAEFEAAKAKLLGS